MTPRRARAIEALGLVVVLWGAGRASVVYFSAQMQAPPMQPARTHSSLGTKPDMPSHTANALVMNAAPAPAYLSKTSEQRLQKRRTIAPRPSETVVPEPIAPQSPFIILPAAAANLAANQHEAGGKEPRMTILPARRPPPPSVNGAAWVVWRPDAAGQPLGTGGQLGGSQAGARLLLPVALKDRLRLSLRAYAPLEQLTAYEVAPGISVRPFSAIPVELIAERRIRGGRQTQDAASVFLAGGGSSAIRGSAWRTDVYAQAGMVGLQHPMLFADGAATVRRSIGDRRAIGVGLWGGIQPGLKRLDIGPSATTMIGPSHLNTRLTLDWRVRIAGEARPNSGIAITLSKDF